jgi:hypothetical protein
MPYHFQNTNMYVCKKLQAECMRNQGSIAGSSRTFIHSNYTSSKAQESDISVGDEGLFL